MLPDHKRHGLVYHTQVSEGIAFDRDDDDDSKVKALNYYFPVGKEVRHQTLQQTTLLSPCFFQAAFREPIRLFPRRTKTGLWSSHGEGMLAGLGQDRRCARRVWHAQDQLQHEGRRG